MLIGITYDLRSEYLAEGYGLEETAEFDGAETIEAVEAGLRTLRHTPQRIGHAKQLMEQLAAGRRWDMVFNIAEGLRGFGREALVPALLDAYDIPYVFSDPLTLTVSLHKGMTKRIIRDLGLHTPDFCLIESPEDLEECMLPFPVFAKPVAEGTGKGVRSGNLVYDRESLKAVCMELVHLYKQPALVEEYLPGREATVGIVGTGRAARVLGSMEICLNERADAGAYTYDNKERFTERVAYTLLLGDEAKQAEETALAVYRGLGIRDAGRIDIRQDALGQWSVIEANPLAGLHPKHSDLPILCGLHGIRYQDLLSMIMESATTRMRNERQHRADLRPEKAA